MDTSVNMKMTPEEHRLIRDAVRDTANECHAFNRNSDNPADERAKARQREAQLRHLLTKL